MPTQQTQNVPGLPTRTRIEEVLAQRGLVLSPRDRHWYLSHQYIGDIPPDVHLFPTAYPPYEYLKQVEQVEQVEQVKQVDDPFSMGLADFQREMKLGGACHWRCCCCDFDNYSENRTLYCKSLTCDGKTGHKYCIMCFARQWYW